MNERRKRKEKKRKKERKKSDQSKVHKMRFPSGCWDWDLDLGLDWGELMALCSFSFDFIERGGSGMLAFLLVCLQGWVSLCLWRERERERREEKRRKGRRMLLGLEFWFHELDHVCML